MVEYVGRIVESLDILKLRFPEALKPIWDGDLLVKQAQADEDFDRPGIRSEHVFDFFSGLRLIVSRERHSGLGVCLHCSASVTEVGARKLGSLEAFVRMLQETLQFFGVELKEAKQPLPTTGSVLHLVFRPEYTSLLCQRFGIQDAVVQTKS